MKAKEKNTVRYFKEKLNLLLEVAQTVNEDSSVENLMHEFERLLKDELQVGKILVFTLNDGQWQVLLQSNVTDQQRDAINIDRDLQGATVQENLAMSENEALRIFDALLPLKHRSKLMGYVLIGDKEEGDGISPTLKNLKFIQILANIIIVFIENKRMQASLIEQEALKRELALASNIQAGLIPPEGRLLQSPELKAISYYHPHQKVGGDYFDILKLSDDTVGICMADVSGKGISAALLMSNFQALVRALFTDSVELSKLAQDLNYRVLQNTHGEKFITAFIGRYNRSTGLLNYINASHLPPLVYQDGNVLQLDKGCIGLGMLDDMPEVEIGSISLKKGNLLVAYTDGLIEVDHGNYVSSNEEDLISIVKKGAGIDETMAEIRNLAEKTRSEGWSFDDTSVLAIEVCNVPQLTISK